MASNKSYTITLSNNVSEKEAISFLLESDKRFLNPDKESRKLIMEKLQVNRKFARAFDLILVEGHTNLEEIIKLDSFHKITLVELKTTRKYLKEIPKGFFFGATENEFNLAEQLGAKFLFCFVSLHADSLGYKLVNLQELNKMVKTKRIQYQINLIK